MDPGHQTKRRAVLEDQNTTDQDSAQLPIQRDYSSGKRENLDKNTGHQYEN